ncbi:MAG: ABC transporter permease subunit [Candidatus Omnitrophota bacterium]
MRSLGAIVICTIRELLRKKDFYVLFMLTGGFLAFFASQDFFGVQGISRYMVDMGYSISVFFSALVAILTSSRQLPSELSSHTVYPLLAKPISRQMIITAKFLGSFTASVVSFSLFFLVFLYFYLSSGLSGSFVLPAQSYLLGILLMGMVCALAVFFSNFLTLSATVTVSLMLYIAMVNFSSQMRDLYIHSIGAMSFLGGIIYYVLPHFEFFDIRVRVVHAWDALSPGLLASIALYAFIYCSVLLVISGALFKRREL